MKVAILYGSTTGKTEAVAHQLHRLLPGSDLWNVADIEATQLQRYQAIVLGTSTWGTGALQDDWNRRLPDLPPSVLADKHLAFFGLGDRIAFADTFCSAVDTLVDRYGPVALATVGPPLLIDDDNEGDRTSALVIAWARVLKDMGLDGR